MKVITIFGRGHKIIKMCPLLKELKKDDNIEVSVCITGQYRKMLQQVLDVLYIGGVMNG